MWITGLPGSGKSTTALAVKEKIPGTVILRADDLRKVITPEPAYSDSEREYVYRALIFTARTLYDLGHNVIIDATGHKRSWRILARKLIPDFIEVYLDCSLAICMEREKTRSETLSAPQKIYEKAAGGWPVPGINVPYEEPESPEIVIDSGKETIAFSIHKIMGRIRNISHE
jgi:adenylylsulfate kinase